MFKKTLLAAAALTALAGSAFAADVTLYGRIDTGLRYTSNDLDTKTDDVTKFEMASGNYTGSRFGLKGEEDLGNGMKVAFVLENGFTSDDGAFKTGGKLFDRQATLHVKGEFGEVAFGRTGILNSTNGSFGIGQFSAMTTGWGSVGNQEHVFGADAFSGRLDNVITYVTPDFAGAKVYAQYGMGDNGQENKSGTDRYAGLGVTYDAGALALRAVVDMVNKDSWAEKTDKNPVAHGEDVDDTYRVTVGGSYDFGMVKPYVALAYFKDGTVKGLAGSEITNANVYDGYGLMIGASAPLAGGTLSATAGYLSAEEQAVVKGDKAEDVTRFIVGACYEYKLSKRTTVYADLGYGQDDYDNVKDGAKPSFYQAAVGLAHNF